MFYCYQLGKNDCGYACLKTVLANKNKCIGYLDLYEDYKDENYSFVELIEIGKKYDNDLVGYGVDDVNELYKEKYAILPIRENDKIHFVVFLKKKNKKIHIFDPNIGLRVISESYFLLIFEKKALILKNKGKKIKKIRNSINLVKYYSFFSVSTLLDFFLLTMCTYYVSSDSSLILIFLLACLFMINSVNKSAIITYFSSKFNKKAIIPLIDNHKLNYDYYKETNEYKTSMITYISENVLLFSSFIFITFILLSDSLYHMIIIGLVSIFTLLISFLEKNKEDVNEIDRKEYNFIYKACNIDNYLEIEKKTMNIVIKEQLKKVFLMIYIIILVFFKMNYSGIESFVYLIFYSLIYLEFAKNLKKIFCFKDKKEIQRKKDLKYKILSNQCNTTNEE